MDGYKGNESGISGGEMNEESIKYALIGLRSHIKSNNIRQKVFADGVTTPEHFSKVLNLKAGVSEEMLAKFAHKLRMEIADLVLIGKQSDERQSKPLEPPVIPGTAVRHVNPNDFMTEVSVFVGQYQKNSERLKFWRAIFENLPIPALIIKDGLVCFQNIKSRLWGIITGTSICDSCVGLDCDNRDECPVIISERTATECSGYQMIGVQRYKLDVMPLRLHEHDYFLVCATDVHGVSDERRSGDDRRSEI